MIFHLRYFFLTRESVHRSVTQVSRHKSVLSPKVVIFYPFEIMTFVEVHKTGLCLSNDFMFPGKSVTIAIFLQILWKEWSLWAQFGKFGGRGSNLWTNSSSFAIGTMPVRTFSLSWWQSTFFLATCGNFWAKSSLIQWNELVSYSPLIVFFPFDNNRCWLNRVINKILSRWFRWLTDSAWLSMTICPEREALFRMLLFAVCLGKYMFRSPLWNNAKPRPVWSWTTSISF